MSDTLSPKAAKLHNRTLITTYLYEHKEATKQVLERELGISLPTITQNLRNLEAEHIIELGELQDSTGGRKAQSYRFAAKHRVAIGVALRSNSVCLCAVDLYGDTVQERTHAMSYTNTPMYYQRVGTLINEFAATVAKGGSTVLGVAFSVQGIVSADGTSITFGTLMHNTGLTLETISQSVHYPCIMIHDSDASAMAELWFDSTIRDAVCVYLERRPGGAVIVNGKLYQGPNQCNGAIEHMVLVPNGRQCYCGQRGCMDTYCSLETLPEEGESVPGFFSVLEQGEPHHRERMHTWMEFIAQTIVNARSVIAGDVVIGGEAAQYLDDSDIAALKSRVQQLTPFSTDTFSLHKSRCADTNSIVGAALRYIEAYVDSICTDAE